MTPLALAASRRCPICLEPFTKPVSLPVCGHWLCEGCLDGLKRLRGDGVKQCCPLVECAAPLTTSDGARKAKRKEKKGRKGKPAAGRLGSGVD